MTQIWKKIKYGIISFCVCAAANASCPLFIQHWNNASPYELEVVGGTAWPGQLLAPAVGAKIGPNIENDWVLFDKLLVNIIGSQGLLGQANLVYSNGAVFDTRNFITLTFDMSKSSFGADCSDTWRYFDLTVDIAPPFITNAGWNNGLGNNASTLIPGNNYWGCDYGADRWSISSGAAYQTTAPNADGARGSRAFAFNLVTGAPDYTAGNGVGNAMDGLWQIQVKIGSNGAQGFSETFYIAERFNLSPGIQNYYDGAGGGDGKQYGREIDILETFYKPGGPQINVTSNPGRNQYWNNQVYQSVQMGNWADVGGAPNPAFVTYGALIRGNYLWIYAYKPDGTQWYCTDAIPNNNTTYVQKGVFVPYIGTYSTGGNAVFETGYNNFIYLSQDDPKIAGLNPKDNPTAFGPVLN